MPTTRSRPTWAHSVFVREHERDPSRSPIERRIRAASGPDLRATLDEPSEDATRSVDKAEHVGKHATDALYQPEALDSDDLPRETQVGRYFVQRRLGAGGMAVVYEAWDPQLDRLVALKVLRAGRPGIGQASPEDLLRAEARTLARIEHPNIVTVYDVGITNERVFLAMELCRAQNLRQWLSQGKHGVREILDVFIAAGRGLAAAHRAGVIHRDFKPANVLIGKDGTVRVADFGMARLVALAIVNEEQEEDTTGPGTDPDRSVSTIVGTPTYMAPEQLLGRLGDHRMDQFSFCLGLYWALLNHPPFAGQTFQERRRIVPQGLDVAERERLNRARTVPVRVRRALLRGLSVDPADRFPSMDALLNELVERRRWPWALFAVPLVAGLMLGKLATGDVPHEPCNNPDAALGEAWDAGARDNLAAAIERTHHPGAGEQLEHAVGAFEHYASEWKQAYSDTCRATYVTHVQSEAVFDERMRCLERRKAQLELAVTTLAQADDAQELDARMQVPFRLPKLDECGDVTALASGSAEVDEPTRARIDELVRSIDEASKMREAGLLQDGLVMATATVSEARELGHLPLLAQALECLGKLQADAVTPQTAEQTLREAIEVGTHGKDDHTVSRAWPSLLYTLVMQQKLAEGESLKFAAELAIDRASDETARGSLYNTLGALYSERGDHERARDYLQRSLGIRIQQRGAQDLDVGTTWSNLGFVLAESQQWSEAADAFEQARAILAATVGSTHPLSDIVRGGLCRVENGRLRHDVALKLCTEALGRVKTRATSPVLESRLQIETAAALYGLGRRKEALELAHEARRRMVGVNPGVVSVVDAWLEQVDPTGIPVEAAESPAAPPPAPQGRSGSRP